MTDSEQAENCWPAEEGRLISASFLPNHRGYRIQYHYRRPRFSERGTAALAAPSFVVRQARMSAAAWIVSTHKNLYCFQVRSKTPRITANDTAKTADSTTATDPAMMNALIMLAPSSKAGRPGPTGVAELAGHRTHSASVARPSIGRGLDAVGSQSSLVPPSYASGEDPSIPTPQFLSRRGWSLSTAYPSRIPPSDEILTLGRCPDDDQEGRRHGAESLRSSLFRLLRRQKQATCWPRCPRCATAWHRSWI